MPPEGHPGFSLKVARFPLTLFSGKREKKIKSKGYFQKLDSVFTNLEKA